MHKAIACQYVTLLILKYLLLFRVPSSVSSKEKKNPYKITLSFIPLSVCFSVCQEALFQERLEILSWNLNHILWSMSLDFLKKSYFNIYLKKYMAIYAEKMRITTL